MILPVSAHSPWWVRDAAAAVLALHIGGASVGMVSGATAMVARKGGRWHALAGHVFFVSMLIMSGIGAAVSPFLPQMTNVIPGLFTFYLVISGWLTARRRESRIGPPDIGVFLLGLSVVAVGVSFGLGAAASPSGRFDDAPPMDYYVPAAMVAFAAALDLRMILSGGMFGRQRIARHLWRMTLALLIAVASFFLGQQKVFPIAWRGSPILALPVFAVLGLLVFWMVRVRLGKAFKTVPPSGPAPAAAGLGDGGQPDPLQTTPGALFNPG